MIVIALIGFWFYNTANKIELNNKYLWVIIGIASYFVPQFIAGVIIGLTAPSLLNEEGLLYIIGLAVGIIGAVIAHQLMLAYSRKKEAPQEADYEVLDDDILKP